ncbi:MAG: MFS transporter [Deltaproteobacteria bacterium]|nr:MFS transporter [Deltaproteobacteria bacterium]
MSDSGRSQKAVLVVATLTAFMMPFMMSALNLALPAIQKDFGLDAMLLNWVVSAYILAAAVSLVPSGKLADIYGRKKIFILGVLFFFLASLFVVFAKAVWWLIFWRVVQGVGGGMVMSTGMAMITSVFPLHERGKAIGLNVAAVYTGLSVGPVAGGFLTATFGWRSIFLVTVPLGVLAFFLSKKMIREDWAEARGESFDLVGSLLLGAAFVCFMYGLSLMPTWQGTVIVLFGILFLILFVRQELRTAFPVFEVRLFRDNRVFAFSGLAALINYGATSAVSFLLSLYLQYILGLGPQNAGLILLWQPVIMALLSPLAGRLSDRIEPRIIASCGMGLTALGLLQLVFLQQDTGKGFVVLALIFLGLGFALFSSPNMNAIMSSVEKRYYGVASGAVGSMRLSGNMLSMAVALVVFALFLGPDGITPQHYPSLLKAITTCFGLFALLCLVGIFFSFSRGDLRQKIKL